MRIHRRASAILIDVIEIKQENNLESWTPAKSHILFHLVISGKTASSASLCGTGSSKDSGTKGGCR